MPGPPYRARTRGAPPAAGHEPCSSSFLGACTVVVDLDLLRWRVYGDTGLYPRLGIFFSISKPPPSHDKQRKVIVCAGRCEGCLGISSGWWWIDTDWVKSGTSTEQQIKPVSNLAVAEKTLYRFDERNQHEQFDGFRIFFSPVFQPVSAGTRPIYTTYKAFLRSVRIDG